MIELNFIRPKKSFKIPVIAGIDLSQLNKTGYIIGFLIYYGTFDWVVAPMFEKELEAVNDEITRLNKVVEELDKKIEENQVVKRQLDEFNNELLQLQKKSEQVNSILKEKVNPKKLLERIARNMPKDVWFTSLSIDANRVLTIRGQAAGYQSIGQLMDMLNSSPFFSQTDKVSLITAQTKPDTVLGGGASVEEFEVKGNVAVFDPF